MSKFVKTLLITLAINIGVGGLLCLPVFTSRSDEGLSWLLLAFGVVGTGLVVQLIIGIVFVASEPRRETGKGILLAVGILLLIGLAVCTSMAFGS